MKRKSKASVSEVESKKHKVASMGVAGGKLNALLERGEREEEEQGEEVGGGERRLKRRLTDAVVLASKVLISVPAC